MVKETKFYDLLGVPPTADENSLKKAYRLLFITLESTDVGFGEFPNIGFLFGLNIKN